MLQDSTLIKTKSGRVFSSGRHDWQWWDPSVPERLRQLHESGYDDDDNYEHHLASCTPRSHWPCCSKKVVIFTNQQGVSKGHVGLKEIQGKLGDICKGLSFTPSIFMATGADSYRKPSTGMWRYMVEYCNDDIQPGMRYGASWLDQSIDPLHSLDHRPVRVHLRWRYGWPHLWLGRQQRQEGQDLQ